MKLTLAARLEAEGMELVMLGELGAPLSKAVLSPIGFMNCAILLKSGRPFTIMARAIFSGVSGIRSGITEMDGPAPRERTR